MDVGPGGLSSVLQSWRIQQRALKKALTKGKRCFHTSSPKTIHRITKWEKCGTGHQLKYFAQANWQRCCTWTTAIQPRTQSKKQNKQKKNTRYFQRDSSEQWLKGCRKWEEKKLKKRVILKSQFKAKHFMFTHWKKCRWLSFDLTKIMAKFSK